MFRRFDGGAGPAGEISFTYDDRGVTARQGDSVAAALLAAGIGSLRETPLSGAPRAPYCLMGVCFDCLMEIDGVGNRQACLVQVTDGMVVRRQHGARSL